jgi:hypothetical protein
MLVEMVGRAKVDVTRTRGDVYLFSPIPALV